VRDPEKERERERERERKREEKASGGIIARRKEEQSRVDVVYTMLSVATHHVDFVADKRTVAER
jgi:hypothetical protein